METLTGAVELLRLPKPGGGIYSVEYRRPIGVFDSQTGPSVTGVLIHTESPDMLDYHRGDSDTALIDMHPDGTYNPPQWENAALQAGRSSTTRVRGIIIQNVGADCGRRHAPITMPLDTTPPGRPVACPPSSAARPCRCNGWPRSTIARSPRTSSHATARRSARPATSHSPTAAPRRARP